MLNSANDSSLHKIPLNLVDGVSCYKTCVRPQHDRTARIYALHKITIALKFMSYINLKLRPSYPNRVKFMSNINWKFRTRKSGANGNWRGSLIEG